MAAPAMISGEKILAQEDDGSTEDYDTSKSCANFHFEWIAPDLARDTATGTAKYKVVIDRCALCGAKLEESEVYATETVSAAKAETKEEAEEYGRGQKMISAPVHTRDVLSGTREVYKDAVYSYKDAITGQSAQAAVSVSTLGDNGVLQYTSDQPVHETSKPAEYEAPTCTQPGSISGICDVCGLVMNKTEIPVTDHVKDETQYETVKEVTCTAPEKRRYRCKNCGQLLTGEGENGSSVPVYEDYGEALGHDYVVKEVTAPDESSEILKVTVGCAREGKDGCSAKEQTISVTRSRLKRITGTCAEGISYRIPSDVPANYTGKDLTISAGQWEKATGIKEYGQHHYTAKWVWDENAREGITAALTLTCDVEGCPGDTKASDGSTIKAQYTVKSQGTQAAGINLEVLPDAQDASDETAGETAKETAEGTAGETSENPAKQTIRAAYTDAYGHTYTDTREFTSADKTAPDPKTGEDN